MSELTDALEKLSRQFDRKGLHTMERMHPGLSRADIAELTKSLPFALPEAAVELFEWRNGFRGFATAKEVVPADFFEGYRPMTLQHAIEFYFMAVKSFSESYRSHWFPLFKEGGGSVYCIDCAEEIGTIWDYDLNPSSEEEEFGLLAFRSLTKMITTIIVCYEQDAYYWNDKGDFEIDFDKSADIAFQENPDAEYWKFRAGYWKISAAQG